MAFCCDPDRNHNCSRFSDDDRRCQCRRNNDWRCCRRPDDDDDDCRCHHRCPCQRPCFIPHPRPQGPIHTFNPSLINSAATLTVGTLYILGITVICPTTVSSIVLNITTGQTTVPVAPATNVVGIYNAGPFNVPGASSLRTISTDQGADWSTSGQKNIPVTSTVLNPGRYYIAVLNNGIGTQVASSTLVNRRPRSVSNASRANRCQRCGRSNGFLNDRFSNDGFTNDEFLNDGFSNDGFPNDEFSNDGSQNRDYFSDGFQDDGFRNDDFNGVNFPGRHFGALRFMQFTGPFDTLPQILPALNTAFQGPAIYAALS